MAVFRQFLETAAATLFDVAPIVLILLAFQFLVIRRRPPNLRQMAAGVGYVLIGLTMFLIGLEQALFPLGEAMARQLTAAEFVGAPLDGAGAAWGDYLWVYLFAAAIGFATTVAEPALIAVSLKAEEISGQAIGAWALRVAVAIGVAAGVALGAFRIVDDLDGHRAGGHRARPGPGLQRAGAQPADRRLRPDRLRQPVPDDFGAGLCHAGGLVAAPQR
jgi:hypothetical protein